MRRNYERGRIVARHSMMRYDVLVPGREHPWTSVGTLNPAWFDEGETVMIGFVGANRQLPVILTQKEWRQTLQAARAAGVTTTAEWYAEHATWARGSSWTAGALDLASAVHGPGLAQLSYSGASAVDHPRYRGETRALVELRYYVEGEFDPEAEDPEEPQGVGPVVVLWHEGFQYRHDLTSAADFEVVDWDTFSADNLCVTDSAEVVLGWSEGYDESAVDRVSVISRSGVRKTITLPARRREFADTLIVGDWLCTPLREPDGTDRLAITQLSSPITFVHQVALEGAESSGLPDRVWDENQGNPVPVAMADSTRVYLQDRNGGVYCVDPGEQEIVWASDLDRSVRLLSLVPGGRLLCAWEQADEVWVDDTEILAEWYGVPTSMPRLELDQGHSLRAGLCYLQVGSGLMGATSTLPETVNNGALRLAHEDYWIYSTSGTFVAPDPPENRPNNHPFQGPNFDNTRLVRMGQLLAPGWIPVGPKPHDYDQGKDGYTDPNEDGEEGPFGTARAIYNAVPPVSPVNNTGSAYEAAWVEQWLAAYEAYRDIEAKRLWPILAQRRNLTDWCRGEWSQLDGPLESGQTLFPPTRITTNFEPPANSALLIGTPVARAYVHGGYFRFSYRILMRTQPGVVPRVRSVARHALGPVAVSQSHVTFPALQSGNGELRWQSYNLNNLTPEGARSAPAGTDVMMGSTIALGNGVYGSYSTSQAGSVCFLYNPTTGVELATTYPPGDSLQAVFDGVRIQDRFGGGSLGPA